MCATYLLQTIFHWIKINYSDIAKVKIDKKVYRPSPFLIILSILKRISQDMVELTTDRRNGQTAVYYNILLLTNF
jgi:hypothetical protein